MSLETKNTRRPACCRAWAGARILLSFLPPARAGAVVQAHALAQVPVPAHLVQQADGLPGVAPALVALLLQIVQFLQHPQGDDDLVVAEGMDGFGAVDEHVGVDHESLHGFAHCSAAPARSIRSY